MSDEVSDRVPGEAASRADLTRSLCINAYRFAEGTDADRSAFLAREDARFGTTSLEAVTREIAERIGARILSLASERFQPEGASATLLIGQQRSAVGHLDKSHISVHTFSTHRVEEPGTPRTACFRIECETSTCGADSPLAGVAVLMNVLQPDIMTLDGRVRGVAQRHAGMPPPVAPGGYETVSTNATGSVGWYVVWARDGAAEHVQHFLS